MISQVISNNGKTKITINGTTYKFTIGGDVSMTPTGVKINNILLIDHEELTPVGKLFLKK